MIWSLIVGAFIGWLGSLITNKDHSMGWIKNIIAGLIGSAVGQALLGSWGLVLQVWQLFHLSLEQLSLLLLFHFSLEDDIKACLPEDN